MKVSVIYWSATGNTEDMAAAVAQGAKEAGAEVVKKTVAEATASDLACDVLLLGCPAMGAETLEEEEFEPFFSDLESSLSGKKLGLFGSYDWGDGEWMRSWQERALAHGAILIADGVIANLAPDDEAIAACQALGTKAAKG